MASGPITLWQIVGGGEWGGEVETVADFIFLGSKNIFLKKLTAAMKLKHSPLGSKARINLDSVLKRRDISFLTKVCIVKAMVFLAVM